MREIKFRGKDIETGEWLYGDLIQRLGNFPAILYQDCYDGKVIYIECAVDKDSVGQYTGSRDKDGKEIYEGDVVQSKLKRARKYDEVLQICFNDSEYEYCGKNEHGSSISLSLLEDYHTVEVIGNIHDNPELINN